MQKYIKLGINKTFSNVKEWYDVLLTIMIIGFYSVSFFFLVIFCAYFIERKRDIQFLRGTILYISYSLLILIGLYLSGKQR